MEKYLDGLNKEQICAVTSCAKHLRIIAGAGTGKTRALTYRIAYLLASTDILPSQLVAITFTNKVANEMKERVYAIVSDYGLPVKRMPLISTYHGFCLRFLRSEVEYLEGFTKMFTISDDTDRDSFLKQTAEKMNWAPKSPQFLNSVSTLNKVKCMGIMPDEVKKDDLESQFLKLEDFITFYKYYQAILKKNNTLDFDDILIFAYEIIKNYPEVKKKYRAKYRAFLVDEYQDTNDLQYKLLKEFLDDNASLTVVGDPDQTIYTWRGANSDLIRSVLTDDFKDLETVVLNKNYRSTQTILDTANTLINKNVNREKKDLIAASGLIGEDIDVVCAVNQESEARYIANKIYESILTGNIEYKDIAIIYRSNYLSMALEKALVLKRIPYRIFGGHKFYDRIAIKDALAYLKIMINPNDDSSVLRILKAPTRGIGPKSLQMIKNFSDEKGLSYLQSIVEFPYDIGLKEGTIYYLEEFKRALGKALVTLSDVNIKADEAIKAIETYFEESRFIEHINKLDRQIEEKEGKEADKNLDNVRELLKDLRAFLNNEIEDADLLEGLKDSDTEETDMATKLSLFLSNVMLMSQQDEMDKSNSVNLMTVHVSKGLEFKEVYVTGLVNGIFPTNHALHEIKNRDEVLEEERRMLYVALTRAQSKLHVTWFEGYSFVSQSNCFPSMFLAESGLLRKYKENKYLQNRFKEQVAKPKINKYNSVNDIKSLLTTLPSREKNDNIVTTSGDLYKQGLTSTRTDPFDFKLDMKVISTSYGIGVITGIDKDRITAYFPEKEGPKKEVKFINGSLAFKPYQEN